MPKFRKGDRITIEATVATDYVLDLARMCEAVRHSSGLGKHQWERVEKARAIAAKADQALKSSRAA